MLFAVLFQVVESVANADGVTVTAVLSGSAVVTVLGHLIYAVKAQGRIEARLDEMNSDRGISGRVERIERLIDGGAFPPFHLHRRSTDPPRPEHG